jgi:hypothetical protein
MTYAHAEKKDCPDTVNCPLLKLITIVVGLLRFWNWSVFYILTSLLRNTTEHGKYVKKKQVLEEVGNCTM